MSLVAERPGEDHVDQVPHLRILLKDRVVLSQRLRGQQLVIGRSDRCDVALPSETVSRQHCVVEARGGDWWLIDRSRHGTFVDNVNIDEVELRSGMTFRIGVYEVRFELGAAEDQATRTRMVAPAVHEELVEVSDGSVHACRASVKLLHGPLAGRSYRLTRARNRVGGHGAHVVVDVNLPVNAVTLRVVRGRVMVEPGDHPSFLMGQRVRELTPVLPGEAIRIGDAMVEIDTRMVQATSDTAGSFGDLVGESDVMQGLFRVLERIARHDATVLVVGESGTGKELAASALHENGLRGDGPFIAVNCASIPHNLVESELFGHEKGAFTGATNRREGAFQRAHGGTLFLDELGEMHLDAQAKLLRALESGEVRRVGANAAEFPDVRVVAATNQDLQRMVAQGTFRRDLLFRLAVLTVRLPPLRIRLEDIGELSRALLARHHPGATISNDGIRRLQTHQWPGNVRELRNVLTRAVVLGGDHVSPASISFDGLSFHEQSAQPAAPPDWNSSAAEREELSRVLRDVKGNRSAAARVLGIPRTSLLYKLRKHGLV